MHGAQILPFLGAPFERFDLFRVGWGGVRGSRTALALYGAVLVFRALSPFARGGAAVLWVRHTQLRAAPRSRARYSCCRARLRVRRARCPRVRCAYIPCRPMRGKRIRFASLGLPLAFHAPSLPCAFVPRRRALLNWLALRMRVTPTAPLPRLCCGRSDGIGGGLPHRLRAASSRPRLHRPVHITTEAAGLCRLPPKTWRCDGVSLNCRCSAVLF